VNCWQCGLEPDDVHQVFAGGVLVREIPEWPPGDHVHAPRPPSPAELEWAGVEAWTRIVTHQ
jgi:hypothetical protein